MGGGVIHEETFYGGEWTKMEVEGLVSLLRTAKRCGDFDYGSRMSIAIKEANDFLKREFKTTHSDASINDAIDKLYERYQVWEKLMNDSRIGWDKDDNTVGAKEDDWEDLSHEDWRVCWYEYHGEPLYEELRYIFGPNVIHNEPTSKSSNVPTYRLNEVNLPPLPLLATLGKKNFIYLSDSPCKVAKDASSPFPMNSPSVIEVSKDEFRKSVSASGKKKSQRKLFACEGSSPISSEGSSPGPTTKKWERVFMKFEK